jgi:protoheme IX farnesyltransferase
VVLKPLTPQNIVIGGAVGADAAGAGLAPRCAAMWARGADPVPDHLPVDAAALLGMALYRAEDYRKSGLPMLPITHGPEFTRLQVLLYTIVLFAATLLPFIFRMSGPHRTWPAAVVLGGMFIGLCLRLLCAPIPAARCAARVPSVSPSGTCSLLFAALLLTTA